MAVLETKAPKHMLVVNDYYSCYPEIEVMESTTTVAVINRLMCISATCGLPNDGATDNTPNLMTEEFEKCVCQNRAKTSYLKMLFFYTETEKWKRLKFLLNYKSTAVIPLQEWHSQN